MICSLSSRSIVVYANIIPLLWILPEYLLVIFERIPNLSMCFITLFVFKLPSKTILYGNSVRLFNKAPFNNCRYLWHGVYNFTFTLSGKNILLPVVVGISRNLLKYYRYPNLHVIYTFVQVLSFTVEELNSVGVTIPLKLKSLINDRKWFVTTYLPQYVNTNFKLLKRVPFCVIYCGSILKTSFAT